MTDPYRALCAELLGELQALRRAVADELGCPSPEPSVVQRARIALAQPELQVSPKNCWLDDEPDIWPSPCVFEDPEEAISNCAHASVLHSEGKCKTDCQHYRQPH